MVFYEPLPAELASICHQEGVPLLVDEAHGGHLGPMAADVLRAASASVQQQQPPTTSTTAASVQARQQSPAAGCVQECQQNNNSHQPSSIPLSALQAGADLVMHSSHKVLTAMTQAAMLHLSADARVQPSRISKALQVGMRPRWADLCVCCDILPCCAGWCSSPGGTHA